ncbi:N-alpha-acetyltransferase 25, NatB auxiliary subunit-like isoform X2 [Branchiostoma lanceolatum]|uniref:N-alpha-acetyltransferase 25, NatB auxiliary subunit-like isoform X2 n=1 Tax=Branchiostoma lanceolatum TaxID=7740 RepID=UPI0034529B7B
MAGRGHVDVSERRLRPIYDALDASNNKKAIQEADKVLRKQKDLICAKALKAIALLRSSRRQEALLLAAEVASQEPIEEATLQALTICYREMERGDLVARIYENAVKKVPQSEEFLSHLFMAYVRLGEYKKQQQTGMALYKVVPKNPYYFWSVMSIVMQALTTEDEKLSQKMFLPLAERMVEKMAKDMKIEAEAEVRLYLMILEKQKKYEEALEVVVGPLGSKLISEIELQSLKQAELYVQLEDWPKANAKYRKLLLTNPDNWLWYIHYFNSLFHLVNSGWTPSEADEGSSTDVITGTVDMAIAFVEERVEDELKNGKRLQRGPFLARMELLKRLTERGNQEAADKIGSPSDLLKEYFGKFGDKPSCFMDMRPYLTMMKLDDHAKFVEELQTYLEIPKKGGELSLPSDVKSMQRHICCVGLARSLGLQEHLTERNRDELIQDLMRRHQHGLQFGKDLLPTDVQPSDSYLLMTVHIKYAVYLKTQERSLLFEMIVMLEKGVACSPSNAQYKLILIKLYILLGAFQPCKKLYDNMEIKHIQQDTLGHFYSCYAVALGHLTSACSILSAMLKFFSANHKDTTEYIIAAYKYGSFHKIPEIISFRERLNLSHNYSALAVERMLLDFIMETTNPEQMRELLDFMEISPEKDEIKWDLLKDNRDMTVLSSWEPKERELTDQQIEQSFCQDKQWLRLRSLILRSLAAVILMSQPAPLDGEHSLDKQDASKNGESQVGDGNTLLSLILEINAHVQDVECQPSSGNMYLLCGPVPTRMKVYLDGQHHILLTSIFQVAVDVHSLETSDLSQSQELQEQISRNFDCILKTLEYVLDSMDTPIATPGSPPQVYPQVLQGLVLLVETLCLMALVTSQCQVMLKPLKATLTKKKKKKKNPTTIVPQVFNDYKMFVDSLVQFGEKLHKCLMEVNTVITGVDVSTLEIGPVLEHAEKDAISVETVWKKVKDSYQISVGEMSEVLKQKLQFLRTIRL